MSKLGLAGVSLVAAIPGGVLTALLVLVYFKHANELSGMMWAISVPTLLTSVLVMVLPVGVLLFAPSTADAEDEEQTPADQPAGDEGDEGSGEAGFGDFDEEAPDSEELAGTGDELTFDEEDDSGETVAADEDLFMEDDDDFDMELDEDDDEER